MVQETDAGHFEVIDDDRLNRGRILALSESHVIGNEVKGEGILRVSSDCGFCGCAGREYPVIAGWLDRSLHATEVILTGIRAGSADIGQLTRGRVTRRLVHQPVLKHRAGPVRLTVPSLVTKAE